MKEEQSNQTTRYQFEAEAFAAASALQIRLDSDTVVRAFELDLRGLREVIVVDKDGEEKIGFESVGNPLANKLGQQSIMGHIRAVINNQVVQGVLQRNNKYDDYAEYLQRTRVDIAKDIMTNLRLYGIKEDDFGGLMSKIMRLVELFASRTINDGERKTFSKTTTVNENSSSQVRGNKFSMPFMAQ